MARWVEYCQATKGKHVVTGLVELRKIYPTPEPEKTDEEAANEVQDGTAAALVDGNLWRAARRQRRQAVVARALTAMETDGVDGLVAVLETVDRSRRVVVRRPGDGIPVVGWEGL